MYQLYYSPGACSMAVHVVLNELNQPVELMATPTSEGKQKSPEYLKINPLGAVPTLVEDGHPIHEGAAQMIYLMDKHNSSMLPKSGKERATALEWLCFGNATMHPAYGKAFFIMKNVSDKALQEQLLGTVIEQINKLWAHVDAQLAKTPYVCGKQLTAADILLTVIANWGGHFPSKPVLGENVTRLIREISQRPAYQKALKAEKVEYKAAA